MYKIRNIILLLTLLPFCNSHSQTYEHSRKDNLFFEVDKNSFQIYKRIDSYIDLDEKRRKYKDSINHCGLINNSILSDGKTKIRKNKIVCYDPKLKRYYTFAQVNDSTLICTKHTALFVKGDLLKLSW